LTDTGALTVSAAGQAVTLTQNNAVTGTATLTGAATQFTNTLGTTAVFNHDGSHDADGDRPDARRFGQRDRCLAHHECGRDEPWHAESVGSANLTATGACDPKSAS
jgi:hypothetical protein